MQKELYTINDDTLLLLQNLTEKNRHCKVVTEVVNVNYDILFLCNCATQKNITTLGESLRPAERG